MTAPTVPFLLELAGSPYVACKAELLDLLGSICRADQWHSAAAAVQDRKHGASYQQPPGWEAAARTAVYAGRSVIEGADRVALAGIIYVLRRGVAWRDVAGVWPALHPALLTELRAADSFAALWR